MTGLPRLPPVPEPPGLRPAPASGSVRYSGRTGHPGAAAARCCYGSGRAMVNTSCSDADTRDMDAKAPLARCEDCPLRDRPFVPGHGPPMTDRVIVGEAPGQEEVAQGKPLVGKAGRRLNESLSAARVDRLAVHITNTVLCHPQGNESPPPAQAVEACH